MIPHCDFVEILHMGWYYPAAVICEISFCSQPYFLGFLIFILCRWLHVPERSQALIVYWNGQGSAISATSTSKCFSLKRRIIFPYTAKSRGSIPTKSRGSRTQLRILKPLKGTTRPSSFNWAQNRSSRGICFKAWGLEMLARHWPWSLRTVRVTRCQIWFTRLQDEMRQFDGKCMKIWVKTIGLRSATCLTDISSSVFEC